MTEAFTARIARFRVPLRRCPPRAASSVSAPGLRRAGEGRTARVGPRMHDDEPWHRRLEVQRDHAATTRASSAHVDAGNVPFSSDCRDRKRRTFHDRIREPAKPVRAVWKRVRQASSHRFVSFAILRLPLGVALQRLDA